MLGLKNGWTLVELVIIIVLLGILAVVVAPRISTDDFKVEAEATSLVANIRYAQHKSMVSGGGWSIQFQPNSYTIRDDSGQIPTLPGGENPVGTKYTISSSQSVVYFDYLGRPAMDNSNSNNNLLDNVTITLSNRTIMINKIGGIER